MAERRARRRSLQVNLDYVFDRLRECKLAQAYGIRGARVESADGLAPAALGTLLMLVVSTASQLRIELLGLTPTRGGR